MLSVSWNKNKVELLFSVVVVVFKTKLEDIILFMGPLITLFWTCGDFSSGFQSQSGQPYSYLAEAYVLHVKLNYCYIKLNYCYINLDYCYIKLN